MRRPERFAAPISCPACGQVGSVTWEEIRIERGNRTGSATLISVSNGFHTGESVTRYDSPRVVCDRCDTELPN